jgi:hypothetical protein
MFLTKEKVQELQGTGIDEKIEKFAELFPNGTEVTRELCIKHPDVFSFGLPGARLMPRHVRWKTYWEKVRKAKIGYKCRVIQLGHRRDWATRGCSGMYKRAFEQALRQWEKDNPNYVPGIFKFGPPMPLDYCESPSIALQVLEECKIEEERLARDCNLELALMFYDATIF